MERTTPQVKDSLIIDNLNHRDDSIQVQDLDFFGPWHSQNNSLQHQIALIKKTYTSTSNHNELPERPVTHYAQGRTTSQQRSKLKPSRKLSIDQSEQFIEQPKYDQSRQIQKIITEFFTDDKKQRKRKNRNYGFFVGSTSSKHSNTSKNNIQQFQTTQMYFDKIANKMLRAMPATQTSFQKYYKNPGQLKNIKLDLPMTTKSYFPPQILINSCKRQANTTLHTTPSNESSKKMFLAKTGKAPIWRVSNYISI